MCQKVILTVLRVFVFWFAQSIPWPFVMNVLKICIFLINMNGEGGEREEKGGGQGGGKKTPNILGGQARRLITASFINKIHVFYISLRKTAFVGVSFWQGPFVTLARFVLVKRLEICSLFSGQMARYSLYPDGPKCLIPGRSQQGPNGFRGATPGPWQPLNLAWLLVGRELLPPGQHRAGKCHCLGEKGTVLEPPASLPGSRRCCAL